MRLVELVTKTRKPLACRRSCQLKMRNPFNACLVVCGRALLRTSSAERRASINHCPEPRFVSYKLPLYRRRPGNLFVELIQWTSGFLGRVWTYHTAPSGRKLPKGGPRHHASHNRGFLPRRRSTFLGRHCTFRFLTKLGSAMARQCIAQE